MLHKMKSGVDRKQVDVARKRALCQQKEVDIAQKNILCSNKLLTFPELRTAHHKFPLKKNFIIVN